jgi:hypothetical protein
MPKPESVFRAKVRKFLKTLSHTVVFSVQQISLNGTPDMLLCVHGKFVALELKSRGGRVTPLQQLKLDEVRRARGVSIVADPDNWEETKEFLTLLDGGVHASYL